MNMKIRIIIQLVFLNVFIANAQETLPFPTPPSASTAGATIAESTYKNRVYPSHLPKDAPNIVIILIDDVGPGLANTFGGEINTPSLTKLANQGISYNRFHSTAMCSPTRAALLTGRNHTRVGSGQITEWANDWDGFSGLIPRTSATVAEVLKNYGYSTAAFGKWHNSNPLEASKIGPFDTWPTSYGFEYFYGFLAGETSQYEPTLIRNTSYVSPPKTPEEGYHLTDDLADNAIEWMRNQKSINPDKPFFMYWAPGAAHGPHHVNNKWSEKYKGKFDDGWDAYRERVFKHAKEMGWIPQNTKLTPRPANLASWASIPETERPFQRRLMEVYAGFVEHTDYNAGRLINELEKMGIADNTLVFYIWGDNGSSSEGQNGTISELLAQNQIPTKITDHMKVLNDELGGLNALGGAKTDNMFHAGWAWGASTPFKGTKLLGSYFGGTRQPMVVSWPKKIKADKTPHSQFHHVNDITPTIYDALGITPPKVVNGYEQDPIDGISMVYTFNDAKAKDKKQTQFFDIMGSRGIYHDGWFAGTFGPRVPWMTVTPGIDKWSPNNDVWELYNLNEDFSQANDLAKKDPKKLKELQTLFMEESVANKNMPIGGGLYVLLHPEEIKANRATEFNYDGNMTRLPEFVAPRIGYNTNKQTIKLDIPENANGVILAMAGYAGGLTLYMENGVLNYEYNLFEIQRTKLKSQSKLPVGKATIEVSFKRIPNPDSPRLSGAEVTILVNGKEEIKGIVPTIVNSGFSANECFDIGIDLGSPVSEAYYDKAPFKFNGTIESVNIKYLK